MELLKVDKTPAEFKWQDVTFKYRTEVTAEDKFEIDISGQVLTGGKIEFKPWELYRTVIRIFVTGWEGVTMNGIAVPYAFETLMKRLPGGTIDDLVMKLGYQIALATGILPAKKDEGDLKNESGGPSNG